MKKCIRSMFCTCIFMYCIVERCINADVFHNTEIMEEKHS